VEREVIEGPDGKSVPVVHNYGHAGYGYQTAYGCSEAVVRLVDEALQTKAKL
jgi:hypothetical protein